MLTAEQARDQLKKAKDSGWEAKKVKAAAGCPERPRSVIYGLLHLDERGKEIRSDNWSRHHEARNKATAALTQLRDGERQQVFNLLFPKLARHLELTWELLPR